MQCRKEDSKEKTNSENIDLRRENWSHLPVADSRKKYMVSSETKMCNNLLLIDLNHGNVRVY